MAKAANATTETKPTPEQLAIPIGSTVKYLGKRNAHTGKVGTVTGYRGPTTGLWIEFTGGAKASASVTRVEVVDKAAKRKPASKSASRVKKATPAQAIAGGAESSEPAESASA